MRCRLLNVVKWAFSRGLIWDRKPELSKVRGVSLRGCEEEDGNERLVTSRGVI